MFFVLRAVHGPSRRKGLSQADSRVILELLHALQAAKALHIENARKTGVSFNAKTEIYIDPNPGVNAGPNTAVAAKGRERPSMWNRRAYCVV
jgi:hypothetical protein